MTWLNWDGDLHLGSGLAFWAEVEKRSGVKWPTYSCISCKRMMIGASPPDHPHFPCSLEPIDHHPRRHDWAENERVLGAMEYAARLNSLLNYPE